MILQYATINGHSLVLGQAAGGSQVTLPTGSEGVDAVSITFSGQSWDAFTTRKAQFWRDVSEIYETAIDSNGVAAIPEAILYSPGIIHFAVKGTDSQENTISTNDVIFSVCRGAFTSANAPAPSPSLFELAVQEAEEAIMAAVTEDIEEEIAEQIGERVPDPTQADEFKFFRGDKTWAPPSGIRNTSERNFTNIPAEQRITMDELLTKLAKWYVEIDSKAEREDPYDTPAQIKALVQAGRHNNIPVGTEYEAFRMTEVSAAYSGSGITGVTVDPEDFIEKLSSRPAVYQFVKYGGKWYLYNTEGDEADLAEYGVTVSGSPANGSSITVTVTAQRLVLDVADHDKCCSSDENSVVFLSKDIVSYWAIPLSEPQLLIHAKTALAPGKYRFTLDHGAYGGATGQDGTYIFSVGTEIPAGGGIRHSTVGVRQSSYSKAQITGGTVTTYGTQPARSVIESGIAVYEWDGAEACTDLGTAAAEDPSYLSPVSGLTDVNFTVRNASGSNRYANSSLRKWLNSDGKPVSGPDTTFSYWWTPSDCFDMPPAESARKLAGFLYGLDPELAAKLGEASVVTRVPVPDQAAVGKAKETLSDKVFLVSMAELYPMGTNPDYTVAEGGLLALFDGDTGNELKIKYYSGTAHDWFTRSAYKNDGYYLWYAESDDGAGHITLASAKQGVVPAMIIKAPKEEEA